MFVSRRSISYLTVLQIWDYLTPTDETNALVSLLQIKNGDKERGSLTIRLEHGRGYFYHIPHGNSLIVLIGSRVWRM